MSDIVTDRNFQVMAERMISEALFPTIASYDTFPAARYPATARFHGEDDFQWLSWPNGDGMIRWHCKRISGPSDYTAGLFQVDLVCEVGIAQRGTSDPSSTTSSRSARQIVTDDTYKAEEVLRKQLYDSTLTSSAFGIDNTTTIPGQGTSPTTFVLDVLFGDAEVDQFGREDEDDLGPNGWISVLPVTIQILVR